MKRRTFVGAGITALIFVGAKAQLSRPPGSQQPTPPSFTGEWKGTLPVDNVDGKGTIDFTAKITPNGTNYKVTLAGTLKGERGGIVPLGSSDSDATVNSSRQLEWETPTHNLYKQMTLSPDGKSMSGQTYAARYRTWSPVTLTRVN